jgi:hypothetical protein
VRGQQIIRKIDYYDPTMTCGSDDPYGATISVV